MGLRGCTYWHSKRAGVSPRSCYKLQNHLFMIRIMSLVSMPTPRKSDAAALQVKSDVRVFWNFRKLTDKTELFIEPVWKGALGAKWVRWRGCYLYSEARGRNGWRVSRQDEGRLFEVLKRCFVVMFFLKYLFLILKRILCGLNECFLSNSWKDNKPFRNVCVCLRESGKSVYSILHMVWAWLRTMFCTV